MGSARKERDRRGRRAAIRVVAVGLLVLVSRAPAAYAIKIVTYNVLNYHGTSGFDINREPAHRTVLAALGADVICVQEIASETGYNNYRDRVVNHPQGPGGYAAAPFVNGRDTDNALFFRSGSVTLVSNQNIPTDPAGGIRDWSLYRLRLTGYTSPQAELYVFVAHLSSGGGPSQREIEANVYRDWAEANLPPGAHVVCCGDFNLENSGEPAFARFTETRPTNRGRLRDPVSRLGNWSSSAFADVHTQSPQVSEPGYAGGGLDDRFDLLLTNDILHDGSGLDFLTGSYRAFGNDGQHYNVAITSPPVIPEGSAMAAALYTATDHLPVVMELLAPPRIAAPASVDFRTVVVGATVERTLTVENTAPTPGQPLTYSMVFPAGFTGPTNVFVEPAGGGGNAHTLTMPTGAAAQRSGVLTINNNSPDDPAAAVALSGTIVRHAVPSTEPKGVNTAAVRGFGAHAVGGFTDRSAEIYNFGFDALQAPLEAYAFEITGDPRLSVVGFAPTTIGAEPGRFTLRFDDAGAAPGDFTATLVFRTRDDPGLPGAAGLDAITFELTATVTASVRGDMNGDGSVNVADIPLFVAVILDPASASATQRFLADMNGDGRVDGVDAPLFVAALLNEP